MPAAAADSASSTDYVVPTPTDASVPYRWLNIATSSVVRSSSWVISNDRAAFDQEIGERHQILLGDLAENGHDPILFEDLKRVFSLAIRHGASLAPGRVNR